MTPLVFNILVHYYVSPEPYTGGGAPTEVNRVVDDLVKQGMLKPSDVETQKTYGAKYCTTEKADFWIKEALSTPLPVPHWVIPERKKCPRSTS